MGELHYKWGRPGLKHHMRVGSGSYAPFTSLLQDRAPLCLKLLLKCSGGHSCSSRESQLRIMSVKCECAPSACLCDNGVKLEYVPKSPRVYLHVMFKPRPSTFIAEFAHAQLYSAHMRAI